MEYFWNGKRKAVNCKVVSELLLAANSPRCALVILFWAHDVRVSDDLLSKLYAQLEAFVVKGIQAYRPVTYFPGSQCVLQDIASFHKRNNSSGLEHTGKKPCTHRGELSWIVPNLRGPATSATSRAISTGDKHRRMCLVSSGDCQHL